MTLYRAKSFSTDIPKSPSTLLYNSSEVEKLECQILSLVELNKMFNHKEYYFGFPLMSGGDIRRLKEIGYTVLYRDLINNIFWIIFYRS